jgi:hypothetical protein
MKIQQILERIRIDKLDDDTVFISNKHFNFSFTIADSIVKEEFKGAYRYFGGLQCQYEPNTYEYIELEKKLCELSERVLNKN